MMHPSDLPAHSFFRFVFHKPRPPDRKTARARQTKRCPPPPIPPLKRPLTGSRRRLVVGQTKCFRVGSLGPLWAWRAGRPAGPGLGRPLSILTHLYAITPHPSPPSCATGSLFFCFFSDPSADNSLVFRTVLGSGTELEEFWFGSHGSFFFRLTGVLVPPVKSESLIIVFFSHPYCPMTI